MELSASSAPRRVVLIGQQSLQNSILLGYIHQRTGIDGCLQIIPEWNAQDFTGQRLLVLLDMAGLRDDQALDLLEQIQEHSADARVAFFAVPPGHAAERMISWPVVCGLFYADTSYQQLCKGVAALFDGEYWLPRQLLADYLRRTRQKPKRAQPTRVTLTKRELQVLRLTATGATNVEIAEQLNVSLHTVKTHIYNLFKKIGAANRVQAINWAKECMADLLLDEAS